MNPKRPIRDLERQLRREPDNLALRLTLAAGYREAARAVEALALYRSVARAYAEQGRTTQAAAVCRSALELAPEDGELYGLLVHLERQASTTRPPPLGPAPAQVPPPVQMLVPPPGTIPPPVARPATIPPPVAAPVAAPPPAPAAPPAVPSLPSLPTRAENPMFSTVKRVPPPPPRVAAPSAPPPERVTPLPRLSSADLETPLPPPLPLHDARDSVVEMPGPLPAPLPAPDEPEVVIPLTIRRGAAPPPPTPAADLAALSSSGDGERPSSADFAAEMVTRRRPKLSARDLELLSLEGISSDSVPTLSPVEDPALDPDLDPLRRTQRNLTASDDDEPTMPPGGGPSPSATTLPRRDDDGAADDFEERPFEATLSQLGPDGAILEGPLGVFAMLPAEAATELARRAVVKPYVPGEVVIREGDPGDACHVIVTGEVAVQKQLPGGEVIELARLGDGSLFGEFALLADRRRHATVTAVTDCEIYEIPRLLLRELAAAFPEVGPALESFYRQRLLSNLLVTAPLFDTVPAEQRAEILARFDPLRVESGQAVVRQGERAGGLYLIVLGAVEVVRDLGDRRATVLATLGEGAYFGEMSLLSGEAASASVVAAGPCELAVLPPREFYDVVAGNPALWSAMRGEAEARKLANARILAGRTGVV